MNTSTKQLGKRNKRAVRSQIEIHHASEAKIAELTAEDATASMLEAHSIITACGSWSEGPVQLIRGVNLQGRAFGQINGIQKCLNPVCPHCGPELLQASYAGLGARMGQLKRSGELDGCITYAGAFTCQHRDGDNIAGLIKLLRGAEATFRQSPIAKELIKGWVCGTEITTGAHRGNGAHPHTQFFYTLKGTDSKAHEEFWEAAEIHFRTYFQERSEEVIGSPRRVSWQPGWVSPEGAGLSGFYGRNPAMDWDLLREVTHGNMKNRGIWEALSPGEYAEFLVAMNGGRLLSMGGCWAFNSQDHGVPNAQVIIEIDPSRWNNLEPETKQIIRTVTMCPECWSVVDLGAYVDLATQDLPGMPTGSRIRQKFYLDCERVISTQSLKIN